MIKSLFEFKEDELLDVPHFHVVLVEPEIPQNTGNIGRLCVGSHCRLHLIQPLGFSLEDRYMKRAGLDYWKHLDWKLHDSLDDFLETVKPANFYFFSKKAVKTYWDVSFKQGDALIFGKETKGLPEILIEKYSEQAVKIPMPGETRSINLANSVAVAVYEGMRQLHVSSPVD
ncbi:MAG: tRNA (uridine(34)/cytosine(34)/5-carboxymethylaminomethyluridine(34)-2'-O)-methyltransferase TrmL [Acidobacteria bacterium]|nr:MAG: tRNA (uridine(34)/cytosine(34)/5-carboxymethylaminomethyluridine(34)-2'-O)-methyltransferase TrmL [Acidobacteriota bacterium]RLE21197.1 MAG: tRNA (uridine(34)/cytosine(34)/5-carboxymethylaminomethyluridine(34)-2'-O)-methyltransferase TrmL [Acidobacteriota bacterium]